MSQARSGKPPSLRSHARRNLARAAEQGFTCVRCGQFVTCAAAVAGVQNRNHCPCCLWSRHLDWRAGGDRRSDCLAPMEPIGLTTKRSCNKYASERDGELMIIHRCARCGQLVINRIAADDSAESLFELFERSCAPGALPEGELAAMGVAPLGPGEGGLLRRRLVGAW
jgi:hypothetical protein